ncbi:winged helix-turn-helix domain-containing protein [Plantactinospora sp. B6F1]|uniref:winged helix-turn-helix domain-containing protein n=1 Tax=Plantactinospora sp. B6F1 TaxID=3158971 RepID=UPI0032D9ACB0
MAPYSSIYERIADEMAERIASGEFPPGAKLPTRAELCAEYEVSDFVADRVFLTLKLRGLTETVPGRGVYVKKD